MLPARLNVRKTWGYGDKFYLEEFLRHFKVGGSKMAFNGFKRFVEPPSFISN